MTILGRPHPLLAVALLLVSVPSAAAEPPGTTLAQLEKALSRSDLKTAGRPMSARMRAVVSKPDGSDREEVVTETVGRADGTAETAITLATKDGKDVTAQRREEQAKRDAKRKKEGEKPKGSGEGNRKPSLGMKVPAGDDRKLFAFGDTAAEGSLLVAGYEPIRGAKGEELSRGKVAWNVRSGEPAWIEAQLVDPPTGLKELKLRAEFSGTGDAIYTRVLRTTGVGGVLWIKRKFDITIEMTPASAP